MLARRLSSSMAWAPLPIRAAFAAGSGSAIRAGSLDYCAVPRSPPVRTGAYRFNQFGDAERCVLRSGQRPQSAVLERWMFATGTRRSGATCAPMPRPRAADSMLSAAMDPITRCLRGVNPGPGPGVGLTHPGLGSPEFNSASSNSDFVGCDGGRTLPKDGLVWSDTWGMSARK